MSDERNENPHMFQTKVNYDKNDDGQLTCKEKECKDTCGGDSGKIVRFFKMK